VNKVDTYVKKFGSERVAQMGPMLTKAFAAEGLPYSFGGLTGSTMDSHRLIAMAEVDFDLSVQDKLVEELFLNYFGEEKFINDRSVLLAAAVKAGMPESAAAKCLDDPTMHRTQVLEQVKTFARGVRGVPHFIADGSPPLSGAQDVDTFVDFLQGAAKARQLATKR